MARPDATTFHFANGETRTLAPGPDISVLGLDDEGYVVVQWAPAGMAEPMTYALTDCCQASAKGCDGYIGCRACYAEVDPKLGGDPDPIVAAVLPARPPTNGVQSTTKERKRMSSTKSQPAAEQFAALGIPESQWTAAMKLAVKQKWANLPVDVKVDDLRARLEAVVTPATPTSVELEHAGMSADAAATEAKRLKRNAKVNAWRARNQLQAALDARALKFAAMRAKKVAGAA